MTSRGGPLLGCIADDYTGATDVASGLRRVGMRTVLFFGCPALDVSLPECDAVVVALKSRNLVADEAIALSLDAYRWLQASGIRHLYFKYCSTFDSTDDGNIGPVADALVEATRSSIAIVCPASPEHARTIYQGHLFVGRQLLSESSMRHHPLTPMTDSNLVRVLGRQTPHDVALIPHELVREGAEAVTEELRRLAGEGARYAVTDAVSDDDLETLAAAGRSLGVLTGGAGLARAFGRLALPEAVPPDGTRSLPAGPAVILAGSCSAATLAQVEVARARFSSYQLRPDGGTDEEMLLAGALKWLDENLGDEPVLVYSSAPPKQRAAVPDAAAIIERTMGALARRAVARGARRVVVAGGETSGAVVGALNIDSVTIVGEIDRGVPWTVSTREPAIALLLKSGNFGAPDVLVRAAEARA